MSEPINQFADKEIVEHIRHNSHRAFKMLFERYQSKIYYFVLELSKGDRYLAEEVVQKVFITIWEKRNNLSTGHSIQNYLYVIARNQFLKEIARMANERISIYQCQEAMEHGEEMVDQEVELKMLMERIEQIVSEMPPARQQVYRMRHMEHLSQKEIAQRLKISENTVESYLKLSSRFLSAKLLSYKNDLLNGIGLWLIANTIF